ncbi:hypothetical protein BD779DRAFT_1562196, partial [Infundibulicybe gibba]
MLHPQQTETQGSGGMCLAVAPAVELYRRSPPGPPHPRTSSRVEPPAESRYCS